MKSSVAALIWVGASAIAGVAVHGEVRRGQDAVTGSGLSIPFKPSTAFRCAISLNGSSPSASTTLPSSFGFVLTTMTFTDISQATYSRLGSDLGGGRPRLRISVGNCVETHPIAGNDLQGSDVHAYLDYNARVLRFDPPLVAFPNEFVSFEFMTDVSTAAGSTVLQPADSVGFVIGGYVLPPEDL